MNYKDKIRLKELDLIDIAKSIGYDEGVTIDQSKMESNFDVSKPIKLEIGFLGYYYNSYLDPLSINGIWGYRKGVWADIINKLNK